MDITQIESLIINELKRQIGKNIITIGKQFGEKSDKIQNSTRQFVEFFRMVYIINLLDNGSEQRPKFSNLEKEKDYGKRLLNDICGSTKIYL